jgi:tetraacyldisaccharide 4'-kinase
MSLAARLVTRFSKRLQRAWYRADGKDWLSIALLDVSWAFGALVKLRSKLYAKGFIKSTRLKVPVIVVGNVIAGGAGKTPVTIEIVRHLQRKGWRPGVVSRGYGRKRKTVVEVSSMTPIQDCGDEPALLYAALNAPVFVASDRAQAALALLATHPEVNVIVCDDGLQHLALQRDIEICVMDERGIGNARLQPAGPLREHWPRKVDFLLHRGNFEEGFVVQRELGQVALRADGSSVPLADLQDPSLVAVAAIAQPENFFRMLQGSGLVLQDTVGLPDHYDFSSKLSISDACQALICTEKDAPKLRQAAWAKHLNILAVPLIVTLPPDLRDALDEKLSLLQAKPT